MRAAARAGCCRAHCCIPVARLAMTFRSLPSSPRLSPLNASTLFNLPRSVSKYSRLPTCRTGFITKLMNFISVSHRTIVPNHRFHHHCGVGWFGACDHRDDTGSRPDGIANRYAATAIPDATWLGTTPELPKEQIMRGRQGHKSPIRCRNLD